MLVPGASGIYLYAYCIFYYSVNLDMEGNVPRMLYFGYMGLVALAFTFVTGVTGYMATFWFVRTIYGAIKVRARRLGSGTGGPPGEAASPRRLGRVSVRARACTCPAPPPLTPPTPHAPPTCRWIKGKRTPAGGRVPPRAGSLRATP